MGTVTERLRRGCDRKMPNIWLFGALLSSQGNVRALAGLTGAPAEELALHSWSFRAEQAEGEVSLKLRGSCHFLELPGEETRLNQHVGEQESLGEHSLPVEVFK